MAKVRIYKIIFRNEGQLFEVYAESVTQGSLFGFVEVEGLLFGERSQVVIDPTEAQLQKEFEGVSRFHIPLPLIVRIDEVEKRGVSRISESKDDGGKVAVFPAPAYTPGGESNKS